MSILQSIKKVAEQVTGAAIPDSRQAADLVRPRKANEFRFGDDGLVPNHPSWPLVVYRGAVRLPEDFDPAAVLEALFSANGWGDSWRNGIYDYVHYHSRIHEVLGVARGTAKVRFGGKRGRTLALKAGDVAVLPAGTGHQRISASDDFLVVGAYPPAGTYDECTTTADHAKAVVTIPKVGRPRKDPVYGSKGPLLAAWKKD
ncbi:MULTISPECIES: cupin domain-containing protein [unclassified Mesorhizobium]|uniref:cupin domain-containing protein n=1 Tax=unclassified Mesorhizobium TaxID=325217 RepID=UPI001128058B|nr:MULTISPECIES: cupin domain-containing protein [unclassified Mesorhizobium]MBZ9696214.1 cupin domain-containing protein [Mesorhizobium sp. CO1-1-9]TPK11400.1 cupin domain-containing protein [Mesorhizobium sp. B2-5-7]